MEAADWGDDVSLDEATELRAESLLGSLLAESAATFAALLSTSGSILAESGKSFGERGVGWEYATAALAAGAYSATVELHRHLGGERADAFYYGDEDHGLFIRPVGEDLLLLVSFGQATTAGVVRLSTDRILQAFRDLVGEGQALKQPIPFSPSDLPRGLSVVVKGEGADTLPSPGAVEESSPEQSGS